MTNTMTTARLAIRTRRLAAVAGRLAAFVPSHALWYRCDEDYADECLYSHLPADSATRAAFRDAWYTAQERAAAREGKVAAHLTSRAAKARA